MAFSYCPHCGFKNMYSLQAPKFCGGCGEGLNILSAAKQTSSASGRTSTKKAPIRRAPIRRTPQPGFEVDDPDGTDIYEVPVISKLSYSIEKDKNSFSLKDIMPAEQFQEFQEQPEIKPKKRRGRPRKK